MARLAATSDLPDDKAVKAVEFAAFLVMSWDEIAQAQDFEAALADMTDAVVNTTVAEELFNSSGMAAALVRYAGQCGVAWSREAAECEGEERDHLLRLCRVAEAFGDVVFLRFVTEALGVS